MVLQPDKISRFKISGELGKGSMGVVYEGQPADGGLPVAIKVFFPDKSLTPEETSTLLERFEREGQSLQAIRHRNVVEVLEVGTEQNLEYIVMEKLEGYNLKDLGLLGTRFTLAESFDIVLQLLDGLQACHKQGVVHRDIKPANVVRSPQGVIKLADFGIARIVSDATLSREGTVVGTPNYMSPEQIRGGDVDHRSDIFSAGVLFYELLSAKKPFDGPDVTAIMYNVTNVQPPTPRFYNGALPDELDVIVSRALAKDVVDRYQSADEFATALRQLEHDLHYADGSEAFLNALPAAPEHDVLDNPAVVAKGQKPANSKSSQSLSPLAANVNAGLLPGVAAPTKTTIYCIDCGRANDPGSEYCIQCMQPLLKREHLHQMASQQARMIHKVTRGDWIFMTCLSIVLAAIVLLIIWLFFRNSI